MVRQDDAEVLLATVQELLAVSETLFTWKQSQYQRTITFTSDPTIMIVRKYWRRYKDSLSTESADDSLPKSQMMHQMHRIHRDFVGSGRLTSTNRSASVRAASAPDVTASAFHQFWKTGVVGGNSHDLAELGEGNSSVANPLFTISSGIQGRYAVHYGTDPLQGFHLAECFDGHTPATVDVLVSVAKQQFRDWCSAYVQRAKEAQVLIRFHHGDAISFCHQLQRHVEGTIALRIGPWYGAESTLDDEICQTLACESFDIIDTSNLVDHVGILSLVAAAVPLLRRLPTSVFYTESLLPAAEDPVKTLEAQLFSDVTTASLVIGLAPVGYLLRVSTDCQLCLLASLSPPGAVPQQRQVLIRVPWKMPNPWVEMTHRGVQHTSQIKHQKLYVEPRELTGYFFQMYLKMFAYEDWTQLGSLTMRQLKTPLAGDHRFYHRLSIVLFFKFAKRNIETDWEKCMEDFLRRVMNDQSLPIGANQVQELQTWLHVHGLYQDTFLQTPILRRHIAQRASPRSRSILSILFRNPNPPLVLHIALIVPRSKLRVFTSEAPEKIGTPPLHISVSNLAVNAENSFFAIQCFFGKLIPKSEGDDEADVECDESGWSGQSNLIATCIIPADTLLIGEASNTTVALVVSTAPWTTAIFAPKLGIRMAVFETTIDDSTRLLLLRNPPGMKSKMLSSPLPDITTCDIMTGPLKTTILELSTRSKASVLRQRITLRYDSSESALLADGAEVAVNRSSPYTLNLQIGPQYCTHLSYPFPINGTLSHTRVSRKNSWVEVAVPPSSALDQGGYDPERFPVFSKGGDLFSWGLSQVNIRSLPKVSLNGNLGWVSTHMASVLSASEWRLIGTSDISKNIDALASLKHSIAHIFQTFVGQYHPLRRPGSFTGFMLTAGFDCGSAECCDMLIFCSGLYYDGVVSSVVMDAYLIVIDQTRLGEMAGALGQLPMDSMVRLAISREQQVLWKHLVPALVERRRRNDWDHGEGCEYQTNNAQIPISTQHGQSPICRCGEGKALEAYPEGQAYNACARFATRIAMSPISAVPNVERLWENSAATGTPTNVASDPASANAASGETERKCECCGKRKSNLKPCARCRGAWYCNHACQKAAWKAHKRVCNK